MHTYKASRAQQRLWALLTMAFVIVGLSAGAALLKLSVDRYESDYRRELQSLASLSALTVNPQAHEVLKRPGQMTSLLYQQEARKLGEIKSQLKDIRYIYTLAKSESGYIFVVDPTPPGDHDHDGVEDKSFLGDPYPEITSAAKSCFERGIVTVETEPTQDRWGTFISAYAPIFGSSGKVVGVLGVDRHANDIAEHQRDLRNVVAGGILTVLITGTFFGWFFSRKMATANENPGWLRYVTGSNLIFRATILEVLLGCLAVTVFIGAMQNLSLQGRISTSITTLGKDQVNLAQLKAKSDSILNSNKLDPDKVLDLSETSRKMNLAWVFERVVEIQSQSSMTEVSKQLGKLSREVEYRIEEARQNQGSLETQLKDVQRNLVVAFFIATFLALGALMVVRTASIQQQDLVAAKTDCEWHQVAYRQVVENLPVGLFMVADGRISFSNQTWDTQCDRIAESDRLQAIGKQMSDSDQASFLKTIRRAEETRSSFEVQVKLQKEDGKVQTLEARGVPLLNASGAFECLLCFTIDVSQRVRNQEILKGKNREVQSKNRMLSRAVSHLEDNFEAMTQALVKAVEAKDPYTAGHSERVMRYSMGIGRVLKLGPSDLKTLEIGTLIHDIGKIGIPDDILTKPGQLTFDEYEIIQAHALNGAKMVENVPVFKDCVPIIRWHHERLNGSGYPDGLIGEEIPLLVRIAAVADVFDAVTSDRAYRSAMSVSDAVDVLRTMANAGELDPELVEILAEIVMKEGVLEFRELNRVA